MNQNPAISVVLPVYNCEAYVREAVESILAQTFTDFELIIINDGSTDGSGPMLRDLAARDPRIVLVERSNGGLVSALNVGIARARAKFIARMDADDVAMPQRFALQYARMEAEPELGVLGGFVRIMDKSGRIIGFGDYPVTPSETARSMMHGSPLAHPTVMMRTVAVNKVGGYRRAFSHCEDYDLWFRISESGYAIANLSKHLLNYRVHGANVSSVHREAQQLGAIVARLAHRCRKAGLPDPVDGLESIDALIIETVPAHLRQDVDAMMFVLRHANVSLASKPILEDAWFNYNQLKPFTKLDPLMCGFLMRVLNGAVSNRAYGIAWSVFIEAARLHPLDTSRRLWHKLKARL